MPDNDKQFKTGSIISAGANILSSAVNGFAVAAQNRQNLRNWREQNEYNHPKNQVARLKEAGLSPALMYGGGQGGGQASPAPKMERQNMDFSQVGSIISTYLDLKAKDTAIENTRQNTENVRLDTVGKAQIQDQSFSEEWEQQDSDSRKVNFTPYFRRYMQDLENTQKEGTRIGAQTKNIDQNTQNQKQQLDISKLQQFIPEGQRQQWEQFGILPTDDGSIQEIKVLYKMFTGEKMDSSNSKSSGILSKILSFIKPSAAVKNVPMSKFEKHTRKTYKDYSKSWDDRYGQR